MPQDEWHGWRRAACESVSSAKLGTQRPIGMASDPLDHDREHLRELTAAWQEYDHTFDISR